MFAFPLQRCRKEALHLAQQLWSRRSQRVIADTKKTSSTRQGIVCSPSVVFVSGSSISLWNSSVLSSVVFSRENKNVPACDYLLVCPFLSHSPFNRDFYAGAKSQAASAKSVSSHSVLHSQRSSIRNTGRTLD